MTNQKVIILLYISFVAIFFYIINDSKLYIMNYIHIIFHYIMYHIWVGIYMNYNF